MTREDAEEIIYNYEEYEDKSCSCHMGNPPCSKCVNCPSEEDYREAILFDWSK
jgi:hypothetical protein